jgi:hypothetical protein
MATRDLSSQFGPIIEGMAEHGIETVPGMPGMIKVGGLHVPAPHAHLSIWSDPGKPAYHEFEANIPDEKGNLFRLTSERSEYGDSGFWASVVNPETRDHVTMDTADEFADLYKNIGAADPEDATKWNAREIDRNQAIADYMGAERGEWTGGTSTHKGDDYFRLAWDHHIVDPTTGDVRPAVMSRNEANIKWTEDQKWLKEQDRLREQGR